MSGRPLFYNHRAKPHYVYRCFDIEGRLIYVGCSVNPIARIESHRVTSWWATQIHSVRHIVFPNKAYAMDMEREAIIVERPRWNIKSKWLGRSMWSAEDYVDYYTAVVMAGSPTNTYNAGHLKRVVAEANHRYGINLEDAA